MAIGSPHSCARPGCGALVPRGASRCPAHADLAWRQDEVERGSSTARGYDHVWRRLRADYLREHPECVRCAERGSLVPAQVVDHVHPHRGDEALRLDPANLQSLCRSCHAAKTATEGLGHRAPAGPAGAAKILGGNARAPSRESIIYAPGMTRINSGSENGALARPTQEGLCRK